MADGEWELGLGLALLSLLCYVWLRGRRIDPHGRVILITGCDTGIGRATAALLAEIDGLIVVATCRTQDGRAALLRELSGARAAVHVPLLDVTDETNVVRVVEQAAALGGGALWCVVSNAGVTGGSFAEWTTLAEYRRVMDVNFFAAVALAKAALPFVRAARGRLVFVSSATAVEGFGQLPTVSAYVASKAALDAFARVLRAELAGSGVRVLTINPGFTRTAIVSDTPAATEALWAALDAGKRAPWGAPFAAAFVARARRVSSLVGWPPSRVARAVARATLAVWPPRRSWPSPDAALVFRPLSVCPDWLTDALLAAPLHVLMPARPGY